MESRKYKRDGRLGRLPEKAPLANPYVPFQTEDPPKYEARKALVRGTLYPGLDLPFKGMVNKSEKPVTPGTELQVLGFAIQELSLYLDTQMTGRPCGSIENISKCTTLQKIITLQNVDH